MEPKFRTPVKYHQKYRARDTLTGWKQIRIWCCDCWYVTEETGESKWKFSVTGFLLFNYINEISDAMSRLHLKYFRYRVLQYFNSFTEVSSDTTHNFHLWLVKCAEFSRISRDPSEWHHTENIAVKLKKGSCSLSVAEEGDVPLWPWKLQMIRRRQSIVYSAVFSEPIFSCEFRLWYKLNANGAWMDSNEQLLL